MPEPGLIEPGLIEPGGILEVPELPPRGPDSDLMVSRRAFTVSQAAWGQVSREGNPVSAQVGWHDGELERENGMMAVVDREGILGDIIGDIVHVARRMDNGLDREVFVYVYADSNLAVDLSLSRRAFLSLGLLSAESLICEVEIVS